MSTTLEEPRRAPDEATRRTLPINAIAAWMGPLIVTAACLFVFWELHPSLILRNTTAAGGDMGAHVWWPAYLRDHLLPNWRLAGWSPDWYAGFPAGQFYFPLPALFTVILDVFLPYNIAFKIVTVTGPVSLPAAAYVFGRGIRAPRPTPTFLALAATTFLFFKGSPNAAEANTVAFNQHIMGGNLASNLAGEFAFALALSLALFFLGSFAWSLDRRRAYWLPAVLGASVVMCHLVVAIFAVVGALVIWLTTRPGRNFQPMVAIAAVAGLLTGIWTIPLLSTLGWTTDMRYEPLREYTKYLIPDYILWPTLPFVAVALAVAVVQWRRSTLIIGVLTAASGLIFRVWELNPATPVWNLRFLPFWYLGLFMLSAVGVAELVRGVGWMVGRGIANRDAGLAAGGGAVSASARTTTVVTLTILLAVATLFQLHETKGFVDYWASWNYSGYEDNGPTGTGKAWDEFHALNEAMANLPAGRSLWEPGKGLTRYGTTLAPMLLPYFTDGHTASMEGLYYEASATTPYHFLTVSKLTASGQASNPVRGFVYKTISDFSLGVEQLQDLGVRYLLVESDEAKAAAKKDSSLTLVATSPDLDGIPPVGWEQVTRGGAPLVDGLTQQPVVITDSGSVPGDAPSIGSATPASTEPLPDLDRPLSTDGPEDWERSSRADAAVAPLVAVGPVTVSNIKTDERSVSFAVDKVGVPVRIAVSYAADWRATGADGPWSMTPAGMVIVPTAKNVTVSYTVPPRGWEIYEVKGSDLVSPLEYEPVVVTNLTKKSARDCYHDPSAPPEELSAWECIAAPWWDTADQIDRPLAATGPKDWERVDDPADAPMKELPDVEVTDIKSDDDSISFKVDQVGVPVLVKVSAFANWRAHSAQGPYRVTPNLMVVVPTSENVSLQYETTNAEWLGRLATLLGIVGLVLLIRRQPRRSPPPDGEGELTAGPSESGATVDASTSTVGLPPSDPDP